jgi:tight adherence protein B
MDSILLPILVAGTVALLVFGAVSIAMSLLDPERRRLKDRLAADPRSALIAEAQKSVSNIVELDAVTAALVRWPFFAGVNARLIHAYPETKLATFLLIAAGCGVAGLFFGFATTGALFLTAVTGAIGCALPFVVLSGKRARRQRTLADQLPEALDFLSRVLKAGHSFTTGLQMMGEELPKPLASEFRKAYDQHTVGQTVEAALRDMAVRIESSDFAFFVTAVLIQRQTGGDLSEVLKNISGMIRNRSAAATAREIQDGGRTADGLRSRRVPTGDVRPAGDDEPQVCPRPDRDHDGPQAAGAGVYAADDGTLGHPSHHDDSGVMHAGSAR